MKTSYYLLGVTASFALACTTASATKLTNLTTGEVLFYDDYESALEVSHAAWEDVSVDANPAAVIGSWGFGATGEPYVSDIQVTDETPDATNMIDPGPIQGSNYLRLDRKDSNFPAAYAIPTSVPSTVGDVIFFETMIAQSAFHTDSGGAFRFADTDGKVVAFLALQDNGGGVGLYRSIYPTGHANAPNIRHVFNTGYGEWHYVSWTYELGADTYTTQFDDEVFTDVPVRDGAVTNIADVRFNGNGHNAEGRIAPLYLDAVPEVALPGDYNDDGIVNAADYVVWRDAFGSATAMLSNDATPNAVDDEDYSVWLQSFGNSDGGVESLGLGGMPVPEPATVWLALLMASTIGAAAKRRYLSRRSLLESYFQNCAEDLP